MTFPLSWSENSSRSRSMSSSDAVIELNLSSNVISRHFFIRVASHEAEAEAFTSHEFHGGAEQSLDFPLSASDSLHACPIVIEQHLSCPAIEGKKINVENVAIQGDKRGSFDDRIPGRLPARQRREFPCEIFKGFETFRLLVAVANPKQIVLGIDYRDAGPAALGAEPFAVGNDVAGREDSLAQLELV